MRESLFRNFDLGNRGQSSLEHGCGSESSAGPAAHLHEQAAEKRHVRMHALRLTVSACLSLEDGCISVPYFRDIRVTVPSHVLEARGMQHPRKESSLRF